MKLKLLLVLTMIFMLAGCSQTSEKDLAQIEVLQEEITRLEEDLEAALSRINEYEEPSNNYNYSNKNYSIFNYSNGMIGMGDNPNPTDTYNNLKIVGYNLIESWEHELLDFTNGHAASLSIEVSGTLYNFRIARIKWNEDMDSFEVVSEVCSLDEITNTDVLFNSILAEGLPQELLTWEDNTGKEFYYLIGDSNLSGVTNPYIIISELVDLDPWWE